MELPQVGLLCALTFSNCLTIIDNSCEYCEEILGYFPSRTFLYRLDISCALNGGFNAIVSYKTHPSDQISDLISYG